MVSKQRMEMGQDAKILLPGVLLIDYWPMDFGDSIENVLHMVRLGNGAGSEGKVRRGITGEHHAGAGTVKLVGRVADGANS